ncbi:MAG: multidrug efflux SMR transporter [bacterium]|nr:multidrug efflux SMR transporter [bacterium]
MEWLYLLIATVFEIGWPYSMKMASLGSHKLIWIACAVIAMGLSGVFLYFAQKHIPVGTAYAIWTGLGAACTFLIGVYVFHDTLNPLRFLGVLLIITGVIFLKLGN